MWGIEGHEVKAPYSIARASRAKVSNQTAHLRSAIEADQRHTTQMWIETERQSLHVRTSRMTMLLWVSPVHLYVCTTRRSVRFQRIVFALWSGLFLEVSHVILTEDPIQFIYLGLRAVRDIVSRSRSSYSSVETQLKRQLVLSSESTKQLWGLLICLKIVRPIFSCPDTSAT